MNIITRKRSLSSLALLGAAGLVLAGCATAPEDTDGGETADGVDFLACAVSDEGSWNDQSFNQSAYAGLEQAEEELGIEINDAESHSTEDFAPNLDEMVSAGCDIIIGVGFNLETAINEAAAANPESNFVIIDGGNDLDYDGEPDVENLKPINYSMAQSSYLAGYLSAAYSSSKVLGTYGGLQIPAVTDFMTGYYNGALAWGEENDTEVRIVGWDPATETGDFTEGFGDSAGAASITSGQLAQGADVIFPVAGGLFAATSETISSEGAGAVFLGVDRDIALTVPDYADQILVSVEKRMTQAVFDVIDETLNDGYSSEAYIGTLENGGTALSSLYDFEAEVDAAVLERLAEIEQEIIDGTIDPTA